MYDSQNTQDFYDAYSMIEWSRLDSTAYGRLKAIIHTDFIKRYVKENDRVLDAGSGPGRFSIEVARLGARVTVLDISGTQIDLARSHIEDAGLSKSVEDFVRGDIVNLSDFSDGSFDVTICYGGALSYVCERRHEAAAELVRVTRPGGYILVSVMSRYGAATSVVHGGNLVVLADPDVWHLWQVIEGGNLPGFPDKSGMDHPAMHLYTSDELKGLLPECEVLEVAGSNVSAFERGAGIEEVAKVSKAWESVIEVERRLCRMPGLVESGNHMIMVARKGKGRFSGH